MSKISELAAITAITADDLIPVVDGATATRKITAANFFGASTPVPGAKFGDSSNYSQLAADGEMTMVGTARVNKILNLGIDGLAQGGSAPAITRLGNWYGYAFTINDDGFIRPFELPYDWDSSTAITVKIHWYINEAYATRSGEVRWQITYNACAESGEVVDSTTHNGTLDFGDVNIPATAKTLVEATQTIAASQLAADDVIAMQVKRIALVGGSDPSAEPVIVGLEVEYVSNKHGETI